MSESPCRQSGTRTQSEVGRAPLDDAGTHVTCKAYVYMYFHIYIYTYLHMCIYHIIYILFYAYIERREGEGETPGYEPFALHAPI